MESRIIQLLSHEPELCIYALCEDGTIWKRLRIYGELHNWYQVSTESLSKEECDKKILEMKKDEK